MHVVFRSLAASLILVAVPAVAEPALQGAVDANGKVETAAAGAGEAETKPDPIVCERVAEIGSLLRSKKVCMHKSEWQEQRRSDRANIERSQVQRGLQPAG